MDDNPGEEKNSKGSEEGASQSSSIKSGASLSSLSDSVVPRTVDGSDFLTHLRAAGAFEPHLNNQDTFGASKQRNERQDLSQLSELFEASQTVGMNHAMSNEETIGASNRTNPRQNLETLSELFSGPPPPPPSDPAVAPAPPATDDIPGSKEPERDTSASPPKPALKKSSPPLPTPKESVIGTPAPAIRNPLSAGLPPKAPPKTSPNEMHHHTRSVSWGQNKTIPSLNERPERTKSEDSFDSVSSLGADHRRTNTRSQLTLEDVITSGPYEAEAESNIIRALEAQHSMRVLNPNRPRSDTGSSSIAFNQATGTSVHDFSLEEASEATFSTRNLRDKEKVPLMNSNQHRRQHRRHESVEQTLAGLTSAMSALHGRPGLVRHHPDEPFSAASTFANNATRLSEQQQEESSHVSARRAWRVEGLPMVRENHQDSGGTTDGNDDDDSSCYEPDDSDDIEAQDPSNDNSENQRSKKTAGSRSKRRGKKKRNSIFADTSDKLKSDWEAWGAFFRPRKSHIATYIKNALFYVILPLTGVAAILFYWCGNPQTGLAKDGVPTSKASVSWWLLFSVREVVTFSLALAIQGLIIDFLALGTKVLLQLVGPVITLLIVQAKGWPFIVFWWAILDFAMLWGDGGQFANHWGYWQNWIKLFNDSNPSGKVVDSNIHSTILKIAVSVSALVAVKRFVVGLYLGRQTFTHYGQQLAKLMNSMLLVSEVASLAKDIERSRIDKEVNVPVHAESFGFTGDSFRDIAYSNDDNNTINTPISEKTLDKVIDTNCRDPLTGSLKESEKAKLMQLLGQWEEPSKAYDPRHFEIASISAVLRFRRALTFIKNRYPFSYAFGPADAREACVDSAQHTYQRLQMRTPAEQVLPFETVALVALTDDGLDQQKAKDLVKLFRPDRDGYLTMLDFVKSVDAVYKEFRMLQASIDNSSQIDRAFENIFNTVFYIIVVTVTLSQLGFNPFALFLSLSSIILAFAFMIGSASSKYFEGLLFILVRRPYGIGDRIHVSGVERDTSIEGSPGWVVEHVTLFETICTWTPTKERCSLSNGSLASSRIINAARSQQAQFHVFLKFPIDTPYDKILIFKTAIEEYMKARPREWLALNGFRANRIVADQGFMEYAVVIQHRESWQSVGQILDSKANLSSYCNEVARQLNMHYRAPPLPVDLRYAHIPPQLPTASPNSGQEPSEYNNFGTTAVASNNSGQEEMDREAHIQQFRQIAMNKHNIRLN